MRTKYKPWAKPFIEENPEWVIFDSEIENSEKFKEFISKDEIHLEVGPGKGLFITTLAQKFPNKFFICVELNLTVSAICAKLVKEKDLKNVFVVSGDMFNVFKYIEDKKVDTIFLNHSDPWPKKRHEKRRLTHKNFTEQYRRILKAEGKLIVKTDNLDFFNFSIESLTESKWILEKINYDYQDDEEFDAITEYTLNWRNKNVSIKRLEAHN
jgi:tRNA (guanine-N7-)-methyltransferase